MASLERMARKAAKAAVPPPIIKYGTSSGKTGAGVAGMAGVMLKQLQFQFVSE